MPKISSLRAKKTANERRIKAHVRKMKALRVKDAQLMKKSDAANRQAKKIQAAWDASAKQIDSLRLKNWNIDSLIKSKK